MYEVEQIARYIIERKSNISAMKLQKLLFYAQAWSLAWEGKPLFKDDFQAWANGPVCPKLYAHHKGLYLLDDNFLLSYTGVNLQEDEKETVDVVLRDYGDITAKDLSDLTHSETPWINARKKSNCLPGDLCTEVISKDVIMEYYSAL